MSDAADNAVTVAARHLPARAALVDRGLMLASRILSREPRTRQSIRDDFMSNAQHAYITALETASRADADVAGREVFRQACLSAYHWAVSAAMVAVGVTSQPLACRSDLF